MSESDIEQVWTFNGGHSGKKLLMFVIGGVGVAIVFGAIMLVTAVVRFLAEIAAR